MEQQCLLHRNWELEESRCRETHKQENPHQNTGAQRQGENPKAVRQPAPREPHPGVDLNEGDHRSGHALPPSGEEVKLKTRPDKHGLGEGVSSG